MSVFTDEDLKRLKEQLLRDKNYGLISHDLRALIARLEAAERYCESGEYKDRIAWKVSKGELANKIVPHESTGQSGGGV